MDIAFLLHMRQSSKCGSVRNDEMISLRLESDVGPWVSILWLLQGTITFTNSMWIRTTKCWVWEKLNTRTAIHHVPSSLILPNQHPLGLHGILAKEKNNRNKLVEIVICWSKHRIGFHRPKEKLQHSSVKTKRLESTA